MSIQIQFLNWDGFYTPGGLCNRRRDPADLVQRAQMHLRRLGFYSGPIDSRIGDALKDAIRHFKYFPDKPMVEAGTTAFNCSTGPEPGWTEDVYGPNPPEDLRRPAADELDADLIRELDAMLPWPPPVGVQAGADGQQPAQVARTEPGRPGTGGTLNVDELAVRVMEVPAEFDLHDEFAAIRIKLSDYERIQSMLIRVYRNFDPDEPQMMPKAKQVYQEVLLPDDIRALPLTPPDDGLRARHLGRAPEMMGAKRWEAGPHFLMKEHAPYKIRVWVSTEESAFVEYTADTQLEHYRHHDSEHWELHREYREQELADRDEDLPVDDPTQEGNSVHDQSEFARGDDPIWTEVDFSGVNLIEKPCEEHGERYQGEAASRYFRLPAPWGPPGIAEELLADPVATYLELWNLRKNDLDFSAKYLVETVEEILRFIMRTRQSLCCGHARLAPQETKEQILETLESAEAELADLRFGGLPYQGTVRFCAAVAAVTDWIVHHTRTLPELRYHQLASRDVFGQPRAVLDESGREDGSTGYRRRDLALMLGHERNLAASRVPSEPSNYVTVLEKLTEDRCSEVFKGFRKALRAGRNNNQVNRAIENPDIILIPSYRPLDEEFFTMTRQVPVYMVGLIDLHYLNADAHRYTPWRFFTHDLFHTVSADEPPDQKEQLWHWMKHHVVKAELSHPFRSRELRDLSIGGAAWMEGGAGLRAHGFRDDEMRRRLCETWHANAGILHAGRDAYQGMAKNGRESVENPHTTFQKAYDIVLFCLLHEPISADSERSYSPAVPDPEDLTRRLNDPQLMDKIKIRAEHYWFGPPSEITSSVVAYLGLAREAICAMIREQKLTSTRSVIHQVDFESLGPPDWRGRRVV